VPLLSPHQILVAMVTITLFMPCIANFLMIAREHGLRIAWAMAAFIFPFAFLVGGLVHRVGLLLS
jgi:ferrous iron transport protein B